MDLGGNPTMKGAKSKKSRSLESWTEMNPRKTCIHQLLRFKGGRWQAYILLFFSSPFPFVVIFHMSLFLFLQGKIWIYSFCTVLAVSNSAYTQNNSTAASYIPSLSCFCNHFPPLSSGYFSIRRMWANQRELRENKLKELRDWMKAH